MIRWSTWNLWAIGPGLERRTEAAIASLIANAPDLCCLQEVRADDTIDVALDVAGALDLHVGRGVPIGSAWWSERIGAAVRVDNVVLSRWPIEALVTTPLASRAGSVEVRSMTQARITTPDGAVRLVSTQLSSSPTDSQLRCRQVRSIVDEIVRTRATDETVLIGGDLNAEHDSDEVRSLGGHKTSGPHHGFVVLDLWRYAAPDAPSMTWDRTNPHVAVSREPSARIDFLHAGPTPPGPMPDVHAVGRFGDAPVGGTWASDHAGVTADLTL